jgi:hypothetical protein
MESRRSASIASWYRGTDWILYVLAPEQGVGYLSLSKTWKKKEGIERQSNKKESDARYQKKKTRSQEYGKKTQAPTRPATDTTGGQLVNETRTHHLLNPLIPNRLLICRLCLVLHVLLAHPIIISQLTNR